MTHSDGLLHPSAINVLILPATSRDADAMCKLLRAITAECIVFSNLASFALAVGPAAGVLIVAEEFLSPAPDVLVNAIAQQPVWSDLPVIVLSRSGIESPQLSAVLPRLRNATVLERPLRMSTFLTVVRSALRARARQYEVQRHLADLSESERRRRDLLDAEREARGDAERQGRMKDEFLATLSHELRTPLNAIMGWSQILLMSKDALPADVTDGLEAIERNARSQTQIIQDLLDMSRIVAGKVLLDVCSTDLHEVVLAAVETVQPAASAKNLTLKADLDGPQVILRADANRLQQVFWNLLSNAVKFTPAGGRVAITIASLDGYVEAMVSDTGEGIAPTFLPYMFDRFRQADASTTRQHGGLGLGLSIVRQLVELHGGTIKAASEGRGKGTVFTIRLPREAGEQPSQAQPQSKNGDPAAPVVVGLLTGVRILIVDDEADARNFVARLLGNAEAEVTTAGTVEEAITAVRRRPPDVLISDIGMPGEDGYDLIRKVRGLPVDKGRNVPAVALTAFARPQDTRQLMDAGFNAHVTKPVDATGLIARLHRVLLDSSSPLKQ